MKLKLGTLTSLLVASGAPVFAQEATVSLEADYGRKYKLEVDITNTSNRPLTSWLVRLDIDAPLNKYWRSDLIAAEGGQGTYAFSNLGYNGAIAPGETVSFGVIVEDRNSGNAPTTAQLVPNWSPNQTSTPAPAPAPTPAPTPAPATPAALPVISGNAPTAREADGGNAAATFELTLNPASSRTVTMDYRTRSGNASRLSDFTSRRGSLTFAPGETRKTVRVRVTDDSEVERDERFRLILTNPSNATFGETELIATIQDNDTAAAPAPTPAPAPAPAPPRVANNNGNNGNGGNDDGKRQTGKYNYAELLQKSLWFYDAQRSGDLPNNYRIPWRGDSALNDGNDVGLDLTGGLYDAGDHVKFGLPMAYSLTVLSWGAIEYKDAYEETGQWEQIRDLIEFSADYFMRCHVRKSNGDTREFYGQVGDGNLDHAFWGPAEAMMMRRPAFKIDEQNPGSDLAAETAASLSAMSLAIRDENPNLANEMVDHAKALFSFAQDNPGRYHESITNAQNFYRSFSFDDEIMWGALWLYRATGEQSYLDYVTSNWSSIDYRTRGLDWDSKANGVYVLMSIINGGDVYRTSAERYLDNWVAAGGDLDRTPGGLISKFPWGSLRHSTTNAFCALLYADKVGDPSGDYHRFGRRQIRYALGDNPQNRSYVVGFGNNPPINPHHRGAHSSTTDNIAVPRNNVHTLFGALVGGPSDANNDDFVDDRTDFIANEVAMDYNAGFTGAVAALYQRYGGRTVTDLTRTTPINNNFRD